MYKTNIKVYLTIGLLFFSSFATRVNAQETTLQITGNGSKSDNTAVVNSNSSTTVTQNNTATIENNVKQNSNTGNNTASGNSGQTAITTGDSSSKVAVANSGNTSIASTCCPTQPGSNTSTNIISGNGANSQNNILSNSNSQTVVSVNQTATIRNNISGNANTGNNTANNNGGNTSIHTGSISVSENINNAPVNTSSVQVGANTAVNYVAKISGNGRDSVNNIQSTTENLVEVKVNNNTDIVNNSFWNVNTGGNKANDNQGVVDITTGNIAFSTNINNSANVSVVTVNDCKLPAKPGENPNPSSPPPPPAPTPQPTQTSSNNPGLGMATGTVSPAIARANEMLAAGIGKILPATGNNWLFYALLANIMMLFMGLYLRLRSGRSPAEVLAF